MKQLLPIAIFFVLLTAFTIQKNDTPGITQMVVTLPGLNSKELQKDLETDFNNLSGIQFIETSLMSQTMIINYDPRKLSPKVVDHILEKWGCSSGETSFQNLVSMK